MTPAVVAAMAMTVMIRLMTVAPAADLVIPRKICMNGKLVGVASSVSSMPVEKGSMMQ